jgi:hypothetical protein
MQISRKEREKKISDNNPSRKIKHKSLLEKEDVAGNLMT